VTVSIIKTNLAKIMHTRINSNGKYATSESKTGPKFSFVYITMPAYKYQYHQTPSMCKLNSSAAHVKGLKAEAKHSTAGL